jgi:hypothetical protein
VHGRGSGGLGPAPAVAELLWGDRLPTVAAEPFDLVLCSELIYEVAGHSALLACLAAVSQVGTVLYFSYKSRGLGEADFVTQLLKNPMYTVVGHVSSPVNIHTSFISAGVARERCCLVYPPLVHCGRGLPFVTCASLTFRRGSSAPCVLSEVVRHNIPCECKRQCYLTISCQPHVLTHAWVQQLQRTPIK